MIFHYLAALQIVFLFVGWGLRNGPGLSLELAANDPRIDLGSASLKAIWLLCIAVGLLTAFALVWPNIPAWVEIALCLVWALNSASVLATGYGGRPILRYFFVSTPVLIALGMIV